MYANRENRAAETIYCGDIAQPETRLRSTPLNFESGD